MKCETCGAPEMDYLPADYESDWDHWHCRGCGTYCRDDKDGTGLTWIVPALTERFLALYLEVTKGSPTDGDRK